MGPIIIALVMQIYRWVYVSGRCVLGVLLLGRLARRLESLGIWDSVVGFWVPGCRVLGVGSPLQPFRPRGARRVGCFVGWILGVERWKFGYLGGWALVSFAFGRLGVLCWFFGCGALPRPIRPRGALGSDGAGY